MKTAENPTDEKAAKEQAIVNKLRTDLNRCIATWDGLRNPEAKILTLIDTLTRTLQDRSISLQSAEGLLDEIAQKVFFNPKTISDLKQTWRELVGK